jgi:hypothetical protein
MLPSDSIFAITLLSIAGGKSFDIGRQQLHWHGNMETFLSEQRHQGGDNVATMEQFSPASSLFCYG